MPIDSTLYCPIYFPKKQGYNKANEVTFRGTDAAYIVHDLQNLNDRVIILESGGGGENIEQTLITGDDANGQNLDNIGGLTAYVYSGVPGQITYYAGAGGGSVQFSTNGTASLRAANTRDIQLLSLNGNVTFGLGTGGIDFTGATFNHFGSVGLSTDQINDNGTGLLLITNSNQSIQLDLGGVEISSGTGSRSSITLFGQGSAIGDTLGNGNSTTLFVNDNTSVVQVITTGGTITLSPMTGYTAATGTESGSTFNESTVSLSELAQKVAKLWNAMLTKGYIHS